MVHRSIGHEVFKLFLCLPIYVITFLKEKMPPIGHSFNLLKGGDVAPA